MRKSVFLLVALLFIVPTASAFDERKDDTVVIAADEVVQDDLYVLASTLIVNGTVTGDVYAIASDIEINGTVEGDVVAFAQTLSVKGNVSDDVRHGGYALTVLESATVNGDVVFAGNGLEAKQGSRINGDVLALGAQATFKGAIADDVRASVSSAEFIGTIGGDVYLNVGTPQDQPAFDMSRYRSDLPEVPQIAPGLSFGDSAEIGGSMAYESAQQVVIPPNIIAGDVVYNVPEGGEVAAEPPTLFEQFESEFGRNLQYFGVVFLLGVLLSLIATSVVDRSATMLRQKLLPSFAWGLVIVFVMPFLLALFVAVIVGGAALSGFLSLTGAAATFAGVGLLLVLFLLLLYLLSLFFLGYVTVGVGIGRIILRKTESLWLPLLLGLLILALLLSLPFNVGLVLNVLVVLLGAGALLLAWRTPPVAKE